MIIFVLRVGSDDRDLIQVQIYKMSIDSWTIVDCSGFEGNDFISSHDLGRGQVSSVFLNGCFHWTANCNTCMCIVSFNIKDEEFRVISIPNDDRILEFWDWNIVNVEESLAAVFWWEWNVEKCQIWVMNDYTDEHSWVLKFCFSWANISILASWKNNLIVSDDHTIYSYDLDTKEAKTVVHQKTSNITGFSCYVDTLAPVRMLH